MINRRIAVLLALFAPLASCVHGSNTSTPGVFQAKFAPLFDILPFPNDIYFSHSDGSANTTGTLSILPIGSSTTGPNAPIAAMDHLDGFGTQSDIDIYFNQPVDATTLTTNIVVMKVVSDPTKNLAVTGFTKLLAPSTDGGKTGDYTIGLSAATDDGGQTVVIKPLKPLDPSIVSGGTTPVPSTYMVIVTGGVKDMNGDPVTASSDYSAVLTADTASGAPVASPANINMSAQNPLLPVAEFTYGQIAVAYSVLHATNPSFTTNNIALTFSFSTQYLGLSLGEIALNATASTGAAAATGLTTHSISASLPGLADIYAGTVTVPYYLSVPSVGDPTAALTGYWHGSVSGGDTTVLDPMPKKTSDQTIPLLLTVPNTSSGCTMPVSGWPVVIFQHGITQNRTNVFAIADGLAHVCFAAIAIDLPLHGITDTSSSVTTNPFYQNQLFKGTPAAALVTGERTFNMDLENNTTLAPGPDGQVDSSGAWFINLTSTITSRDNLREAAADLISLTRTLQAGHIVGSGFTLDGSKIGFVGHSLGGIVGTTYLGVDPSAFAAVVGMPGGHVSELLRNSATFGPIIDGQLAANGLPKGTLGYYAFYNEAQAAVEDGDPANYAALAVAKHPLHMIEVVGDGTTANPPDQVVPNIATDLLAKLMGLTTINTAGPHPLAVSAGTIAQFTAGAHGSLLQPAASDATQLAITTEMQSELVSVFASSGTAVVVTDASHLK